VSGEGGEGQERGRGRAPQLLAARPSRAGIDRKYPLLGSTLGNHVSREGSTDGDTPYLWKTEVLFLSFK